MHLLEKNWDPRRMALVAFGGAGPAHAAAIARRLGIRRVIYPLGAGATSALGCLSAPLSFQFIRSLPSVLDELDWEEINRLYADMEQEGRAALASAGVADTEVELVREADLRIYGQIHEVLVPVPGGQLSYGSLGELRSAFEITYRRLYRRFSPDAVLEGVTWRLTARGPARAVELRQERGDRFGAQAASKGQRPAYLPEAADFVETPVYDRYRLAPGDELHGPAIIEERETTVVLPGDSLGRIDDFGNLLVDITLETGSTPQLERNGGVNA